jgi:hypothetical protein
LAYFPTAIKLFQPIPGIRIKSEEPAEPGLHYQPRLMTLKGQYIEKIKWGTLHWPKMNSFQLLFFRYLFENMLSAYMENTLNGEKV